MENRTKFGLAFIVAWVVIVGVTVKIRRPIIGVQDAEALTSGYSLKQCTPWLDHTGWGTGATHYDPAVTATSVASMGCIDSSGRLWVTSTHVATENPQFRQHGLMIGGVLSSCFPWADHGTWPCGGHTCYPAFTGSGGANPMGCLTPDGTLLVTAYQDALGNGVNFYPYAVPFGF